jgi:hypothetical protein
MIHRCTSYSVSTPYYYTGLVLYCICFIDTIIRFCAAKQKIAFMFEIYTILDILCISSYFCVGFGPKIMVASQNLSRTHLDFSIMRSIFVYKSYMDMEQYFPKSEKGWMIFRLGIKCFLLLAFSSSVIFYIETTGEIKWFKNNGFAHLYACENGTIEYTLMIGNRSRYVHIYIYVYIYPTHLLTTI